MREYNNQVELTIDRVGLIVDVLKKSGKMRRVDLINLLEKKGKMSHATAGKAIGEGVTHNKIIKTVEKASSGKQDKVFLTVYSDIAENEKYHLYKMKESLEKFDARLSLFEKKFSSLSIEEKAEGLERFHQLLTQFILTAESLSTNFGKTKKWADLLSDLRTRNTPINNLLTSLSNKEHGEIGAYLIEGKFWFFGEAIKDLDEYLKENQIGFTNNN